jgi:hypothetical protein
MAAAVGVDGAAAAESVITLTTTLQTHKITISFCLAV